MKSLLKSCALATLFSLALVSTAKAAEQPGNNPVLNSNQVQTQRILIAEDTESVDAQQFKQIRMVDAMLMQYVKMADTAMESMQSTNPEVRKMAQQSLMEANARAERLMSIRKMLFEIKGH
jgi:hypothetical protein